MKTLIAVLFLFCASVSAQTFLGKNGDCTLGGQIPVTQGLVAAGVAPLGSVTPGAGSGVMGSYPKCTVTVYTTGTTSTVALYGSNSSGNPITNPFTANSDGTWLFFVASGCYDITLTSSSQITLPSTRSYTNVCLGAGGLTGLTINVAGIVMPGFPVYWSWSPSLQSTFNPALFPSLSGIWGNPDGNFCMWNNSGSCNDLLADNGTVFKHQRGGTTCATTTSQFNACTSTTYITWTAPFSDANYTVTCTPGAITGGVGLGTLVSVIKSSTSLTLSIIKLDAAAAAFSYNEVDCIGVHD